MCSWALRVVQDAVGERNLDRNGLGHVRIWGTEPGVPYVLPLVWAGTRLAGEPSRDLEKRGLASPGTQGSERGGRWGISVA